jgi:hypothetical protein
MVDDAGLGASPGDERPSAVCPWCSAVLPDAAAAVCPTCQARLVEPESVEIPGVTTFDATRRPQGGRKARLPFGALLGGDDEDLAPPSEADLKALARPDLEVRREMLRLELDARLASLQAEVTAIETETEQPTGQGTAAAHPGGEGPGPVEGVAPDVANVPAGVEPLAGEAAPDTAAPESPSA